MSIRIEEPHRVKPRGAAPLAPGLFELLATTSLSTLLVRVGLIAALVAVVWPAFAHAIEVWSTDEEFSYGFLITPIALAIVWWRRADLVRSVGRGRGSGLLIVAASILVLLVSRRTGIHALGGLAVSPLLVGAAAYLWGWRTARLLAFPSLFLVFGLGLYRGLLNSLGFALQEVTAVGAGGLAHVIGLDVMRDGLVLRSMSAAPQYSFIVAQACSGMSSLLSMLALAALLLYATSGRASARVVVFAAVLPLVVLANTVRVTLVLLVADRLGEDAALGFFHGLSSLVLFGLALTGVLLVSRLVGCTLKLRPASHA